MTERLIAYQAGYDAYFGPIKGKTNPYPEASKQAGDWQDGFEHAQADLAW